MSLRFRKRVQIDANNNLYARDPLFPTTFIIVGNISTPGAAEGFGVPLTETIRFRKAIRFDSAGELFIRDTTNQPSAPLLSVGNLNGLVPPSSGGGGVGDPIVMF